MLTGRLKIALLSLFIMASNAYAINDLREISLNVIKDDKVQSFVAGALTQAFSYELVNYFKDQPIRASSLGSLIILSHFFNIYRSDKGKTKRLLATCAGSLTSSFIKNDSLWLTKK